MKKIKKYREYFINKLNESAEKVENYINDINEMFLLEELESFNLRAYSTKMSESSEIDKTQKTINLDIKKLGKILPNSEFNIRLKFNVNDIKDVIIRIVEYMKDTEYNTYKIHFKLNTMAEWDELKIDDDFNKKCSYLKIIFFKNN